MRRRNLFFWYCFSPLAPDNLPFGLSRDPFSCTVASFQFSCPLSCSPRHVQLPPNDANQFSQEIRTPVTSEACSSRLIRPIWMTDKSKRFLPLVPSAEIPLKTCSCLLQSVPLFFHWCSIFFFFWWLWWVRGAGCIIRGMCFLKAVCGTWIMPVPWIKPSFIFFLLESLTIQNQTTDK